jgi:hypothetical protein
VETGSSTRTLRRLAAATTTLLFVATLAGSKPLVTTQPSVAVISVVDELSQRALANADVLDLSTGQHHFTDDEGVARLAWPAIGTLRVRVRQVGYQPQDRSLQRGGPTSSETFVLKRVAYVISSVRATSHCSTTSDSAALDLSVATLDQLKQGAEKYNDFRRLYPFDATIERRSASVPGDGKIKRILASKETFSSETWEPAYKPGRVIEYQYGSFTVPLLFLSTLADSVFWQHHCFRADGFGSLDSVRVVKLEFFPATDVKGPDYEGTAFLDSATSSLLRVEFHLANLHESRGPKRLEGYITFMSPSPFVRVPDTTAAVWWTRGADHDEWGQPDFAQRLQLEEIRYRKATPPSGKANEP